MPKPYIDLSTLYRTLPPAFSRQEASKLFCGLYTSGSLANLDSQGKGPKTIKLGRKVVYIREDFIEWLEARINEEQGKSSQNNLHSSSHIHTNAHLSSQASSLKKREDNLLLSKKENSLEKIQALYPHLVKGGLTVDVYNNILVAVYENKHTVNVHEALSFAEWELKHNKMRDKAGKPINDLCSWLFRAIGTRGNYRKPEGYLTPEEEQALQKEQDNILENARFEKAQEEKLANEEKRDFETWLMTLSAEKRREIEEQNSKKHPIPPDTFLRLYFKNNIKNKT